MMFGTMAGSEGGETERTIEALESRPKVVENPKAFKPQEVHEALLSVGVWS